jgi:phosphoenolpyruvate carboxykinase (GTP)
MPAPSFDNPALQAFVDESAAMLRPDDVRWCRGGHDEFRRMLAIMVDTGTAIPLDPAIRPDSVLVRSDPADVARVEDRTYIACLREADAGPTNNWTEPDELKRTLRGLYDGAMRGRTMLVIPYSMGPIGSPIARIGVLVTDSPYVAANMSIMARIGDDVLAALGDSDDFVRGLHSVGRPLTGAKQPDTPWPCDAKNKYIAHFPETREIWSYGSGYGGNALLGKKCHALRIASVQARDEGWLAEQMLILKITPPAGEGEVRYIAGAFPSACGKTNLAMLNPTIPGWKVETVGDDIAWMKFDEQGALRAINPEAGFFGVAPGTSQRSNPNAMGSLKGNCVFTNCALTPEHDVWWEDMTDDDPESLTDWLRRPWTPETDRTAAHPNARFTAPARQCPVIAPEWEDPAGVPISAMLFGGRRAGVIPLVVESRSWNHGVFLASTMSSERTAAAAGRVGELRRDPMAMLPFCGYHMGDYFAHWIRIGERPGAKLPRIFHVNWFRRDETGKFVWPGFGENARVLKWIVERCNGRGGARETPIGAMPRPADLDTQGLQLEPDELDRLLSVDVAGWTKEVGSIREHYAEFGDRLPPALAAELEGLASRLG